MKPVHFILICIVFLPGLVIGQQKVIKVNGQTYADGSTAYISCLEGQTSSQAGDVSNGTFYPGYVFYWASAPSNWSLQSYGANVFNNPRYDTPNGGQGTLSAVYNSVANSSERQVTIYIKTIPPDPSFSASPSLCSAGQQGTYSVAAPNVPFAYQVEWQTTGGVLVNGSSSYIGSAPSALSVTLTHNSSGKVRVRFVNSCSGTTSWVEKVVGKPIITPTVNGNPWTTTPYYVNVNANNFLSTNAEGYTQAVYWNTPSPSSVSYGPYAAPYYLGCNTIAPTGVTGFSIKADVTNGCGTSSFTFVLSKPWNGYRVAQNPATSQFTVLVESTDNDYALPDELSLLDEKGTVLRKVTLKTLKTTDSFVAEKSIKFDVSSLPRGTYYLHGTKGDATDKRRVILE
ncbi:MAG: hypothetical protein U0Y10_03675 [Spirosomataceae bacterium]